MSFKMRDLHLPHEIASVFQETGGKFIFMLDFTAPTGEYLRFLTVLTRVEDKHVKKIN